MKMPKKRTNKEYDERLPGDETTDAPPPKRRTSISVGNISNVSGNVNVAGGDITTHYTTTGLNAADIKQLFDGLYSTIDANPKVSPADKEDLKAEVKEIQSTITEAARKNEKVDEGLLSRRFHTIARMAPDMLDVILATLANPLAGLGVAVKRIEEKAKLESRMPGDSTTDAPAPKKKKKWFGK